MQPFETMHNPKESRLGANPRKKPFSTIDDALEIVPGLEKLATILKDLGERKYPFAVRKGVILNMTSNRRGSQIKGSGCTYFLDIEVAKNGTRYLRITQSRKADGDEFERSSIYVFPEDVKAFGEQVSKVLAELSK